MKSSSRPRAIAAVLTASLLLVSAHPGIAGPKIVYVDADAPGPIGTGTSWEEAYTTLAIALALEEGSAEFWVAEGTYFPVGFFGDPRLSRMVIGRDEYVYGGFAGNETEREQRAPGQHPTILSGAIGLPTPGDNSYNVVTIDAFAGNATLDGVFVSEGRDTRSTGADAGGIIVEGGLVTIQQTVVSNNQGAFRGGVHVQGGSVDLSQVQLELNGDINSGTVYEGGLAVTGGSVVIDRSVFQGGAYPDGTVASITGADSVIALSTFANGTFGLRLGTGTHRLHRVTFGPTDVGMVVAGNATVDGSFFSGNKSAFWMTGGSLDISNSTFTGNRDGFVANAPMVVRNSTFVDNGEGASTVAPLLANDIVQRTVYAPFTGPAIPVPPTRPVKLRHSIIDFGCTPGVECTEGTTEAHALLRPLVITDGTITQYYPLRGNSPAIDAGEAGWCDDHDQRGIPRPADGNQDGTAACDIGSYELDPLRVVFTKSTSSAREDAGTAVLDLLARGDIFEAATFEYSATGGTATVGKDFDFAPGSITLDPTLCPGVTPGGTAICAPPGNISIPLALTLTLRDDFLVEPPETIEVSIAPPVVGEGVAATGQHTLTVLDDEPRLKCSGVAATIVGSTATDVITGTDARDVIVARGGDDRISAAGGRDLVCAGPGGDRVAGGTGNDASLATAATIAFGAAQGTTTCWAVAQTMRSVAARATTGSRDSAGPTTSAARLGATGCRAARVPATCVTAARGPTRSCRTPGAKP